MTRSRLAVACTLAGSLLVLILVFAGPSGGQGGGDDGWLLRVSCVTDQDGARDIVDVTALLRRDIRDRIRRIRNRRVRSRMRDLVPENGNNVVDGRDSDKTNRRGVANLHHEFNSFGNYRIDVRAFDDGEEVVHKTITFGVADRESGKCDKPIPGGQ